MTRFFPFLAWLRGYDLATFRVDVVAGLTLALVLVPQSMAYARLAGLPAYYGLYAAFLPPIVGALFGSSRQLATGPVAIVSLMTAAALEPIATAGSTNYIAYALLLALVVGVFQLALGVLRLGLVVNFLSHPVVNGFTNAAAIIIATSQVATILGVSVEAAPSHFETVYRVLVAAVEGVHWPTLGMAALAFAIMIGLRRVNRRIPYVLAAVVVTTVIAWALGFEKKDNVPLASVHSPAVGTLVAEFNEAMRIKATLENHRSESKYVRPRPLESQEAVCLRCHASRNVAESAAPRATLSPQEPRTALLPHELARLLDSEITATRQRVAHLRSTLREVPLHRGTDAAGSVHFYVEGELPPGVTSIPGKWHLLVGTDALKPESVRVSSGGEVVGAIPQGLPQFAVPTVVDWHELPKLLALAAVISLLGFLEAISIAKAMAARTRQKLDPNQELIGQGLANIVGCLGQGYAVSGSFSRSAVALQAGAQTGVANVISGGIVLVVLLFMSPLLYHLPQAVLAAIIMLAVAGLLNVSGFVHAWRANRLDGAISVVTFAVTLVLAPHLDWGIFIGVGLSLGAYLYRSMRPQVHELAPHADGSMRDARRHGLKTCRHISVISFEGPLNFTSSSYLENEILARVAELPQLRHVIIAGNGIGDIDASGEETLRHVIDNLRGAGYQVSFSGLPDNVIDIMKRTHLFELIGEDHFFGTGEQAIRAIYPSAHKDSDDQDCPFRKAMPPIVELSLHADGSLRDAQRHGLSLCRHIAALRFDAALTFSNTMLLEEDVVARLAQRPSLRYVVFVAHGISEVDEGGARAVGRLVERLRTDGVEPCFSGLKEGVLDVLAKTGVDRIIGSHNMFPTQINAVAGIYARAHTGSSERDCPLSTLAPQLTEVSVHPSGALRDASAHRLRLCEHIALLRFDGPLVLASAKAIQSEFIRWAKQRPNVQNVVFLAQALHSLDHGEAENLLSLLAAVREAGCRVHVANLTDHALEDLARRGITGKIGLDDIFHSDLLALAAIHAIAHEGSDEAKCPLQALVPAMKELSLHPDGSLRDAHRHGLRLCQRIVALRFDGPLNYATIGYFEKELQKALFRRPAAKHVLIAGHTLEQLDSSAIEHLPHVFERLRAEGYFVAVSGVRDELLDGFATPSIGADALFPTQAQAIEAMFARAHRGADESDCPLRSSVAPRTRVRTNWNDRRLQVLVLDDEPLVGKRLQIALAKVGCDVEVFEAPVPALRRLEEKEFHIVVTDIRMEDIDGIEVLERVTLLYPETKVIMITGYATVEVAREALAKGAFDFIAKPFKPQQIRDVIAKASNALGFKGIENATV